mgnify:CR=1 FL=1
MRDSGRWEQVCGKILETNAQFSITSGEFMGLDVLNVHIDLKYKNACINLKLINPFQPCHTSQ